MFEVGTWNLKFQVKLSVIARSVELVVGDSAIPIPVYAAKSIFTGIKRIQGIKPNSKDETSKKKIFILLPGFQSHLSPSSLLIRFQKIAAWVHLKFEI